MSDLIKREDAIKAIKLWMDDLDDIDPSEEAELKGYNLGLLTAEREVGKIPAVEPKQGEWERIPYSMTDYGRRCSLCHFKVGNPTNFCPNCSARMKGADDED